MCNGLGYILPIIMFSVVFNFTKFFEITTVMIPYEETEDGSNISTIVMYPFNNATALRLINKIVPFYKIEEI